MKGLYLSMNASRSMKFPHKPLTLETVRGGVDLALQLSGLLFEFA